MAYTFLSDEWLAEVAKLAEEAGESAGVMPDSVSLNLVVTGGPQGDRELHIADGTFAAGLKDDAPTKLTVPYDVARNMFIKGDQSAAMQAFMGGQIKVDGDMSKLMAMQSGGGGGGGGDAAAIQKKLQEITADD
jgi:putative sterol carrier protein